MWGPIIRLKRWLAPRPAAGYVVTLAAEDEAGARFEIDVGVRTDSAVEGRDRGLHFAETLMPDMAFRPVAMRHANASDIKDGENVAQIGPLRSLDTPSPGSGA